MTAVRRYVRSRKRAKGRRCAPFPLGALVRYGRAGVVHVVIATRGNESHARAPSGYVTAIMRQTAHLWSEVKPR